jgi:acetyl esterase/lipase
MQASCGRAFDLEKYAVRSIHIHRSALFATSLAVLALAACSGLDTLNSLAPDEGYKTSTGIVFDDATGLRLDVYRPDKPAADPQGAPVVVFFYGGRWEDGTREQYKFAGAALATRGFVAVVPDYRKYPQVRFPAFLIDSAKLVLMGHSSGAYNAAMLALNPDYLKLGGADRAWLRGMIGLAGPYDFMPITDPDLRDIFGPPEDFEKSQPILQVDGRNPPMLLIHGEDDTTVLVKNTLNLYDRIRRANGTVEKVTYPHLSHGRIVASMSDSTIVGTLAGRTDLMTYVTEFIKRVTASAPRSQQEQYGIETAPR